MTRTDWRSEAACLDVEPERFFPQNRPSREALSPCASCKVRQECLDFALSSPWKPEGIWGGLTPPAVQAQWRERHPCIQPTLRYAEVLRLLGVR